MSGYTRELEDGTIVYSASSIGYCSKALYYDRLGVTHEPPPANIQKAWTEGHDNEARILSIMADQRIWSAANKAWLVDDGWSFGEFDESRNQDYSDQVRVEKRAGNVIVRAHLDGIGLIEQYPPGYISDEKIYNAIETAKGRVVLEAKAFGDSYWTQWRGKGIAAFPTYEWQVSIQMHASGLPCLFLVGQKGADGIVHSVDSRLILDPPISWGKIAAKIARIEAAVAKNEPPDCEEPLMFPCPFYPLHETKVDLFGQGDPNVAPEIKLEGEAAKSVDVYVERYTKHEDLAKQHKAEADQAKKILLEYLEQNGDSAQPIVANKFKVIPKPGGRKGAIDGEKMAKENNLDAEKYRKPSSTWISIEIESV